LSLQFMVEGSQTGD